MAAPNVYRWISAPVAHVFSPCCVALFVSFLLLILCDSLLRTLCFVAVFRVELVRLPLT